MKKIIIMMVAVFAAVSVKAQDKSYDAYVGGGISFATQSYDGDSETMFVITPEIGYSLNDKFGLGVVLGYGTEGSGSEKYTMFAVKPYVRHNVASIGNVNFILDYQVGYQNAGYKDAKTNTYQIGIAPGLAYSVNSRLAVVTHLGFLGYTNSKPDVDGAKATNEFGFSAKTTDIGLSVYYKF